MPTAERPAEATRTIHSDDSKGWRAPCQTEGGTGLLQSSNSLIDQVELRNATSCGLERYNRRFNDRYTNRRPMAVVERFVDGLE